jgi:hypothetical protein
MVEFSDPKGPYQEGIDNTMFIIPAIIILLLVGKIGMKITYKTG